MRPSLAAASLLRQAAPARAHHASSLTRSTLTLGLRRAPSTSSTSARSISLLSRKTPAQKLKNRLWTLVGVVLGGAFAVYAYDSSAGIHRWLVVPVLHAITKDDPEASHKFAVKVLASGLSPVDVKPDQEDVLGFELWGRHFSNPVGLAAGFDKHGEAIDGLFKLGFGYVEIGSVTPEPQPGNPQPRLFRLPSSQSVINRYGFNSEGHLAVLERLRSRIHAFLVQNALLLPPTSFAEPPIVSHPDVDPVQAIIDSKSDASLIDSLDVPRSLTKGKVLAVNLGKNKASAQESIDDFVVGVQTLGPYADVLVVNVSSPNTPGLRSLQQKDTVKELLSEVIKARDGLKDIEKKKPVVLLKIAPDLSRQEIADIGAAAKETKVDGIIVSNTTLSRPASAGSDPALSEAGGLSGPPVKPLAIRTLQTLYALTSGSIPLVGCGGISTGQDALDYARAGASFVQLYTALGYQGVGLPRMIKDEIVATLQAENKTWKDVVGSGVDLNSIKQLGRDVNPAGLLGLEEQESSLSAESGSLAALKKEIEDVLAGKVTAPFKKDVQKEVLPSELQGLRGLPDWNESPQFATQGTLPKATLASSDPQSGLIPEGYPQIIIVETPPKYAPAPLWTKRDVQEKLEAGKELAKDVQEKVKEATDTTKEAVRLAKDGLVEVGRQISHDDFAKQVSDITAAATRQAAGNFAKIKDDISDDEFARSLKDIMENATKEAAERFRMLGRDIKEDEFAKEVARASEEAVKLAAQNFKVVGQKIRDEGDFSSFVNDVYHQTLDRFKALGHDVSDDEFARQVRDATEGAFKQTRANFEKVGRDIRDEGEFTAYVSEVSKGAANDAIAGLKKVGRDIKDEGDFGRTFSETITGAAKDAWRGLRIVGHNIKDEGNFSGFVDGVYHDTMRKLQALGHDVSNDEFAREVKAATEGAFKQAKEGFETVGQDIRDEGHFTDFVSRVTKGTTDETVSRLKALGHRIKDEGDFSRTLSESISGATREAYDKLKVVGRKIEDEGDFSGATGRFARGVSDRVEGASEQVARDARQDSFLQEVKEAFKRALAETSQGFSDVGRSIKEDPLLKGQVDLDDAKRELQAAKEGLREGPTGEPQRSGGGLFSLFSTFGERANVTSESKRIV